ncbi:Uncharacterised protein [Vibrio cholerae]|nr:Uncharacterised protein [Vibrio cholerae]
MRSSKWCTFSSNLFGASLALSIFEHIIGDRVNATIPDTKTEPASVSANSLNSEPVIPPIKAIGA